LTEIREKRRLNYALLLKRILRIPGLKVLYPELPAGVCPLCLPILVPKAVELAHRLYVQSVPAIAWWSGYHPFFPEGAEFAEARYLKDNLVALPVHQQLDHAAVEFIGDKIADLVAAS
jgi:hypothetical protein